MPLDEFGLIRRYFDRAEDKGAVIRGIGDDAAIMEVPAGEQLLVSTDTLIAGRHFPENTAAFDIGWKALAVNLSDLAAMGASARWCTLALTLPAADSKWLEEFAAGFFALADSCGVTLVGGDTTRGPLTLTVTVLGSVPRGNALLRSGAKVGDVVMVSGYPGEAGLALNLLQLGGALHEPLRRRLDRPEPRLELGGWLRNVANACIDVSDGLAQDLGHILSASGVGARIDCSALPLRAQMQEMPLQEAWRLALTAGDDYELCFTVPSSAMAKLGDWDGVPLTPIGTIVESPGLQLWTPQGEWTLTHAGYQHF